MKCEKINTCEHHLTCPWIPFIKYIYVKAKGKDMPYDYSKKCGLWSSRVIVEKRVRDILNLSLTPPDKLHEFEQFRFDRNKIKPQIDKIKEFPKADNNIMIIHGDPGTGKTMALQSLLFDLIRQSVDAFYVTANVLRDAQLNRNENGDTLSYRDIISRSKDCQFFLIDEIGNEGISETGHFEKNLRPHLEGNRKTILASNFAKPELLQKYQHDWTRSRIDSALWVSWYGVDYRGLKSAGRIE